MQEVRFDRLSLARQALILHCMEKAYSALTTEQLYALEKRARQERARFIAALFKSAYQRTVTALSAKVVRHA